MTVFRHHYVARQNRNELTSAPPCRKPLDPVSVPVEISFDVPTVAIWVGLLAADAAASFGLHKLNGGYFEFSSLLPFGGATVVTVGTAALDKANE